MQYHRHHKFQARALACWILLGVLLEFSPRADAQSPPGMDAPPSQLAGLRWPVSLLDAALQIDSAALNGPRATPAAPIQADLGETPPLGAWKRQQVRFRTMAVTGYTIAAISLVASVVTGVYLVRMREDHANGSYSCGPYLTPYLTVPGFVAGLGVGLRGTFAGRRLRVEHPGLGAPDNTRARRMGAAVGGVFSMFTAAASVSGFFCNS